MTKENLAQPPYLAAALALAGHGFAVLALRRRTKAPGTPHGVLDATKDPGVIRGWWRRDRRRNLGVAAGPPSGVVVVDIDNAEAEARLEELAALHGGLPQTVTALTPRGKHLYFKHDARVRSRVRVLGLGLDVRAERSYVVAPPSELEGGKAYRWAPGCAPDECELAAMPEWLVALLVDVPRRNGRPPAPSQRAPRARTSLGAPARYYEAALRSEARQLAQTPEGARNDATVRAALRLGRLSGPGQLSEEVIVSALLQACEENGLVADDGEPQVLATILRGIRAGEANPRFQAD